MNEKEFNLLEEPWLMLMRSDGATEELSLKDAFAHAHEYRRIAGESPLQDVAVLRLMLAVLHSVFGRYDIEGNYLPLNSNTDAEADDVLQRWKSLWELKQLPMPVIESYLDKYQERFWLFHPETPFYQVQTLDDATSYTAAKLNGEILESSNKIRLFSMRTGVKKNSLQYNEAARWLLCANGFDDASAKSKEKGDGSPGAGWLGKLGLIYASGDTLFETLMLNLVMLKENEKLWAEEKPIWEQPATKSVRKQIDQPTNPSELLTLQSRRIRLFRENNEVTGYKGVGGDFFPEEDTFCEQMTLFRNTAKKVNDSHKCVPKRHDPGRKLWRDFASLAAQDEGEQKPGIVQWIAELRDTGAIDFNLIHFVSVSIKYGDKNSSAVDAFSDELSFNIEILTELGDLWIPSVKSCIEIAERLVKQVGYLAQEIVKCSGADDGEGQRQRAMEQGYYRLDEPFRRWLENIEPQRDEQRRNEICLEWVKIAQAEIRRLGRELVAEVGANAFVGRTTKDRNNIERRYTAPEAYNRFLALTDIKRLTD